MLYAKQIGSRVLMILVIALCFSWCLLGFAGKITPIGKWIQVSDVTGKPHSIIQIYRKDGLLYGKVVKGFSENGQPPKKYCTACKGKLKNAKIVGLEIMKGFQQSSDLKWENGAILDPDSGKTYKCNLTLSPDGNSLKVRGYIGISLFGRTQVWNRK